MKKQLSHSVQFDEETEQALQRIMELTGMTIAEVLKRSVLAYLPAALASPRRRPWDIYSSLDLGTGSATLSPAAAAKSGVVKAVKEKHGR